VEEVKVTRYGSSTAAPFALSAILLWSFLALLGSRLVGLPPLLMTGAALSIGGTIGLIKVREWKVPVRTFCIGVGGIFGYHFLLFTAFRHAPTVEANLINYLWPLLIVLLSPVVLSGYGLGLRHVLGALAGLAGAALIVTGGSLSFDATNLPGYVAAAGAALVWALYSLFTKRLPPFKSGAVGGFCLGSGLLALGVFVVESGVGGFSAIHVTDWPFLVLLGVGPMGSAFFLWDTSLKRGDPRVIGALSYLTPMLSTLALVAIGGKPFTELSAVAMALIITGAVVGSLPAKATQARPRAPSAR
jgi:drug/metabolite transporter (DMT)-like permease